MVQGGEAQCREQGGQRGRAGQEGVPVSRNIMEKLPGFLEERVKETGPCTWKAPTKILLCRLAVGLSSAGGGFLGQKKKSCGLDEGI